MRTSLKCCVVALTGATACETVETPDTLDPVALLLHLETEDTTPAAASDAGPRSNSVVLHGNVSWRESPTGLGLDLGQAGWLAVEELGSPGLDSTDWTISLDLRLAESDGSGNRAILQTTSADGTTGRTLLYVSPDCGGALGSLVGTEPVCGTTALSPETWHQVAISYDRTTDHVRLFLDGVLDGEDHVAADAFGAGLLIGVNRSLSTQQLQGSVDEILVLSEAVDQEGLTALLALGAPWPATTCTAPPTEPWLWLEAGTEDLPWSDVRGDADADLDAVCSVDLSTCDDGFASIPAEHLPPLADADFTVSLRARLDAADPTAADLTLVQLPDGRTLLYSDASCGGAVATYLGGAELCGPPLVPGRTAHVALTWSAQDTLTSLYVDGLLVAASPRPLEGGHEGLTLGVGRDLRHQWWDGDMDDFMVWNRVLSPSEVASLAAAGQDLCLP